MIILTIIAFVLIFSLLILVHELGHFLAAKKSGVKVEEFGFGLPPRIWGIKKGETLYSINWIPFGGFVKMMGMEEGDLISKISKHSFEKQPLRKQTLIVCAGVIMNFLLAFVLLTIGFVIGIEPLMADEEDFLNGVRDEVVIVEPAEADAEDAFYLPAFTYFESDNSIFAGILEAGDVLDRVNGKRALSNEDLYDALSDGSEATLRVYRPDMGMIDVTIDLPSRHPIITFIEEDSPASQVGLMLGDQIVRIGGAEVMTAERVSEFNQTMQADGRVHYEILRNGTTDGTTDGVTDSATDDVTDGVTLSFDIPLTEELRVGIGIADLVPYYGDLSLYLNYTPYTLIEIQKERHGFYAPVLAVQEMWRLGKLTAVMFVDVFTNFLSGGAVPDGVAGPVGIAQMTFVNIQNGFAAIIRFVALLSLSLGVVNILPIPALDGGRLVFIIYHALTGHRPNPRIENWIHTAGFFLLILFLFYITFNDVLSFF